MDDLLAVLDAVGSAKTHVLGLWDGAMAAMMFAASNPDRVSSLTLYSASREGDGLRTRAGATTSGTHSCPRSEPAGAPGRTP